MKPESTSFLRFELEGVDDLDFGVFAHTSHDLETLLRRLTERRAGQEAHWQMVADPVIHIAASSNGVSAAALEGVVADAFAAIAATVSDNPDAWPSGFQLSERKLTRRLINRLRKTAPVSVEASNEERIVIPQKVGFGRSPRPIFAAWSTVEGRLRSIADFPSPQFVVFEQGTENPVRCAISPSQYEDAFRNFRSTVRVHGYVYYRTNGSASTVRDVTQIEALKPPQRSLTDFRGLLPHISDELSSGEYIRRLRAGGDE